jgi:hypothetical protein
VSGSRNRASIRRRRFIQFFAVCVPSPSTSVHAATDVATRDVGVFDDVVQQCRDRLTLAPAVLEHERRHREKVRDVGDVAALPGLSMVVLGGVLQRSRDFIGHYGP